VGEFIVAMAKEIAFIVMATTVILAVQYLIVRYILNGIMDVVDHTHPLALWRLRLLFFRLSGRCRECHLRNGIHRFGCTRRQGEE
jgi:hypothetical protein